MEKIKCIGCGEWLQTEDENQLGYVVPSVLEKAQSANKPVLCKRCFRLKNYNELPDLTLTDDQFKQVLRQIADEDALIIKVVDLFDFTGSMIAGIQRFIGSHDIILVGNKLDLFPKAINHDKIKNWMYRMTKDYGFKPLDIALISADRGHGIDALMNMINTYRGNRNVYVVGCTNVGKSTLINRIIKTYTDENDDLITVSAYPGTTLNFIEIPLDDQGSYLIDTPGIINEHQYAHYLGKESLKKIVPRKEIKPTVFQLNPEQTLFIAGLARIDYLTGEKVGFTCYFNNDLYIHRSKLSQAEEIFKQHLGGMLTPPTKDEMEKLAPLKRYVFKVNEKVDLVISGLGFVTINARNAQVAVHAPKGVGVYIRPSLF